jgi:hypothetical protein
MNQSLERWVAPSAEARGTTTQDMSEGAPLDPHDFAHAVIDGLFALVLPEPNAPLRLGLRAVSRAPTEDMRWYVWSVDRPGAFELAMECAPSAEASDGVGFTIRYFPALHEPLFARFSPAERTCRLGKAFDRTGTPGLGVEDAVPSGLFDLASMALDPVGRDGVSLRLRAPERSIQYAVSAVGANPVPCRDVPSLELALAVFDPLVSGLAFLGRRAPARVRAWRRPGFALRPAEVGEIAAIAECAAPIWQLDIAGLAMPGRADEFDGWVAASPIAGEPLLDHADMVPPPHAPWPVNPQWWRAAGWTFSPVGVFCGRCMADDRAGAGHSHQAMQ